MEAKVNEASEITGVSRTYEDPIIYRDPGFVSGTDKCGPTSHYIADYDPSRPAGSQYYNLRGPDATYSVRNSLYFRQVEETPAVGP